MSTSSWFSPNPDKAATEKFFLLYTPFWMASMATMILTGWDKSWDNTTLLIQAVSVALPIFLLPFLFYRRYTDNPWYKAYFFKANLYLFIFGFFGNYFGSEYFFDVLGMVYNFPNATTNLDSALLGSGGQPVPLIMYFYTHAYFMTYHVTANIVLRRLRNLALPMAWLLFPVFVFFIGYSWAWIETKAMANPHMATSFYYEKMDMMLMYGSAIYATYFISSFPIYYFMDEDERDPWGLFHVVAAACTASMFTLYLLDAAAHWVGNL